MREREEVHAIEGRLLHQGLRLGRVPGHRRAVRVPEEVQDGAEVVWVAVQEDPAVT